MEKVNEANTQMLVQERNEEMNHNILDSEVDYRNIVYGVFYRLSRGTVVVNDHASNQKPASGLIPKIRKALPLIVAVPILVRTIVLITYLSKTTLLTKNWAISFSLVATSFHGFISLLILYSWNSNNFFNEFTHRMFLFLKTKDKQINSKPYKCAHILCALFFLFYIYTFGYLSVENLIFHNKHFDNPNSTAYFRESITGSQVFWPVDILIILWTAFVSATTLVLYFLINHALIVETQQFNEELKEAGENGQLAHADLLNNYGNRHLELASVIKFVNDKFNTITTPNLMFFVICHFSNVFVMRGFGELADTPQKIVFINLLLAGAFALLINLRKPAMVNKAVHETKNIIFFQRSIWKELDPKLNMAANAIVDRIEHANFVATVFDGFVISEKLFHMVFLIFPVIVEILAAWKKA